MENGFSCQKAMKDILKAKRRILEDTEYCILYSNCSFPTKIFFVKFHMARNFSLASFFICRLLLESIFGERQFQFVKKVSRLEQTEVTICALSRIMSKRKSELNTDDNFKGKAFDPFHYVE